MPPCELPRFNATPEEIRRLLSEAKTIAVVGMSPKPERPSHSIYLYLRDVGYRVFPVNPGHQTIVGDPAYRSVADIPEPIDIVDIFLRPDRIPPVVDAAIEKKAKAVWMQQGIVQNEAAEKARAAGLVVVMNRCIYQDHRRLFGS